MWLQRQKHIRQIIQHYINATMFAFEKFTDEQSTVNIHKRISSECFIFVAICRGIIIILFVFFFVSHLKLRAKHF